MQTLSDVMAETVGWAIRRHEAKEEGGRALSGRICACGFFWLEETRAGGRGGVVCYSSSLNIREFLRFVQMGGGAR